MANKALNCLLVTTDANAKYRLKSVTTMLREFGATLSATSFSETHRTLGSESVDILFISTKMGLEEVGLFLNESQPVRQEKGIAVVILSLIHISEPTRPY